jgi:hypothetical protein
VPSGTGTSSTQYATAFAAATSSCRNIRTIEAELGLSGNAGRQRLRGRVIAGFAPGAMQMEGVTPFGSPAFILAADASRGTLLLPRDNRVLQNAAPQAILDALIGVSLGPDDLRAAINGCFVAEGEPSSGREYGPDWISVELPSGATAYLHRQAGSWRLVSGRRAGIEIDYLRFEGERPSQIAIRAANANLGLTVSNVEVNGNLPADQLSSVKVTPGMQPITLGELRDAGPLGATK